MTTMRTVLGGLGVLAALVGVLSWRLEFSLPYAQWLVWTLGGLGLTVAVIFGKIIGPGLIVLSLFPLGYAGILLLFVKASTWADLNVAVLLGGAGLAAGIFLTFLGSETVREGFDDQGRHLARPIACARCAQYLGTAGGFESPCPRCGSNRYEYDD